jgi:Asp-tRNA(Asn)/Glu-tRNA(Gln) amidotransferase A subunit family amidase
MNSEFQRSDLLAPPELAGSLTEIVRKVAGHTVSAEDIVEMHLTRIAAVNPRINAIVTPRAAAARAEARELDRRIQKLTPQDVLKTLPLAGVPFTVKDVIAVAGVRSTAGVEPLSDFVPTNGAPAIRRLISAGAILVGKSNCPDFALDIHTSNTLFGETLNPWDTSRTPGGSSGGDAAAVASGSAAFGVGTDYGGSIRWPAHCCGLTSIRPTGGLIPGTGQLPYSNPKALAEFESPAWLVPPNSMSLQGQLQRIAPIARHVGDLWPLLSVMTGPDGRDGSCVETSLGDPGQVDTGNLSCAWFESDGNYPVRDDIVRRVGEAARVLHERGLTVQNVRPRGLDMVEPLFDKLRRADGMADHRRIMGGQVRTLSPGVQAAFADEVPVTVAEYRRLAAERDSIRAIMLEFMEAWNLLLLPVASLPAFDISKGRNFRVGGVEIPGFGIINCCRAISLLNLPAATVPFGHSDEGLPIGVQLVGRPFREHEVIAAAQLLEDAARQWA